MAEYKFPAQVNYGWGLSLQMSGKAPAVAKRIFSAYTDALSYVQDPSDSAIPGLKLSVISDSDPLKNGLYFVKSIGPEGILEKLGTSEDISILSGNVIDDEFAIATTFSKIQESVGLTQSMDFDSTLGDDVTDAIENVNAKIVAESAKNYFNSAAYVREASAITFYHDGVSVGTIDASDFIIDGMVESAYVESNNLVIEFNTAAGKNNVYVPIADIFNPDNYYTKDNVNSIMNAHSGDTTSALHVTSAEKITWNDKVDKSASTTAITSASTDAQWPTAKAVYNSLDSLVEEIEADEQAIAAAVATLNDNKVDTSALTKHTSDAAVHVTSVEKTKWNGKLDKSASAGTITSASTDAQWPTAKAVYNSLDTLVEEIEADEEVIATALNNLDSGKQDTLVSGTNIKTINGETLLGSGNIVIEGSGGTQVQSNWAETSTTDPSYIQNKPTNVSSFNNDSKYIVDEGDVFTSIIKGYGEEATVLATYTGIGNGAINVNPGGVTIISNWGGGVSSTGGTHSIYLETSSGKAYYNSNEIATVSNLSAHTADTTIHVTSAEKTTWNNKLDKSASASTISSASTDAQWPTAKAVYDAIVEDERITAAALTALNNNKADLNTVSAHTADATIHVTSADKTLWNTVSNKQKALQYYSERSEGPERWAEIKNNTYTIVQSSAEIRMETSDTGVTNSSIELKTDTSESTSVITLTSPHVFIGGDYDKLIINDGMGVTVDVSTNHPFIYTKGATSSEVATVADLTTKVDKSSSATAITSASTNDRWATAKAVYDSLSAHTADTTVHLTNSNQTISGDKTFNDAVRYADLTKVDGATVLSSSNDINQFGYATDIDGVRYVRYTPDASQIKLYKGQVVKFMLKMGGSSLSKIDALVLLNETGGTPGILFSEEGYKSLYYIAEDNIDNLNFALRLNSQDTDISLVDYTYSIYDTVESLKNKIDDIYTILSNNNLV